MSSGFWEEQFRIGAEEPAMWGLSARRLKAAADLVMHAYQRDLADLVSGAHPRSLDHLEVSAAAGLLYGYAFENVLKASLLKSGRGSLNAWRAPPHDLVALAERAGISLTPDEADLLRRLSAMITWVGRYPVPRHPRDFTMEQRGASDPLPPRSPDEVDMSILDALFARLADAIVVVKGRGDEGATRSDDGAAE